MSRTEKHSLLKMKDYEKLSIENVNDESNDAPREKKSYFRICFLFMIYVLSVSLAIPAIPALILFITNNNSSKASFYSGITVFLKHIVEFFSSPLLGTLSDTKGRKGVLIISFSVFAIQLILLSSAPSIPLLFFTNIIAGLGDMAATTTSTIITDIATYNNDNVAQKYGYISAMFGLAFMIGPLVGGILTSISISLCLIVAASIASCGAVFSFFILEESLDYVKEGFIEEKIQEIENDEFTSKHNKKVKKPRKFNITRTKEIEMSLDASTKASLLEQERVKKEQESIFNIAINGLTSALSAIKLHFSNKRLRELTIPFALTSLGGSVMFIFYLFINYRFHISSAGIGLFLSFNGVLAVIVQGFLIKRIVPDIWDEYTATKYTLLMQTGLYLSYAFAPTIWFMYISTLVFSLSSIYHATLKAVIVQESLKQGENMKLVQGNLQGVLNSVYTVMSGFGGLLFSGLFSIGISVKYGDFSFLSYFVAACIFLSAAYFLYKVVRVDSNDRVSDGDLREEMKFAGMKSPVEGLI